jgi:hypothetical protein
LRQECQDFLRKQDCQGAPKVLPTNDKTRLHQAAHPPNHAVMPDDGSFISTSRQRGPGSGGASGHGFRPGRSGNPGGRSKTQVDIQTLAQRHGPEAIETLAQALKSRNERVRVAAAAILLDRAYGKPPQAITTDPATSPIALHLLAANAISAQLIDTLEQRTAAINGQHAEPPNGQADGTIIDILSLPSPLE